MAENKKKKNEKPSFAEALENAFKTKATTSEKIVSLAKERDFVYDRIQETKQELEKADKKSSVYSVLKSQLVAMEEYKSCLGQRIKTLVDAT